MNKLVIVSASALLSLGFMTSALAADPKSLGKQEYDNNCAVCHGAKGEGDGVYASFLKQNAPDLTQLSYKNKGVFPFERVFQMIDRRELKGHGTKEMPIWGKQYSVDAIGEAYFGGHRSEDLVRARILAVTEYISRLQK